MFKSARLNQPSGIGKMAKRYKNIMTDYKFDKISVETIKQAQQRIEPFINTTPVHTSSYLDKLTGRKLYFKCENFQKTGSFKYRGATNAVLKLKEILKNDNFVCATHSSGNMGQALSLATTMHGVQGKIVIPDNAPSVKRNAIISYGADVIECESTPQGREEALNKVIGEVGEFGQYVPSADHAFIAEGQGTVAVELLQQVPELDAIVVCCGIGGLISGMAVAAKGLKPSIKIYGGEPLLANDMQRSLQSDKRITYDTMPHTIADGLRMSVGEYTWSVIREYVDDIITASDEEIVNAMFLLWERMKLVVEPSGAMAFAAVMSEHFLSLPSDVKHVGITLSGGNVDMRRIPWMLPK